ncbi:MULTISPECIES: hypothetical protein [unclassified Bradyrhizobium]
MYLDGYDLRNAAYSHRKRLLQELLSEAPETFIFVEHIEGRRRRDLPQRLQDGARRSRCEACRCSLPFRAARKLD